MTLTTENMSMRDKVMAVLEDALRTIKTSHQFIAGLSADIQEAVEAELTEVQEIVKSMGDYVLLHKSHIGTMQAYDMAACGYRTRADIMVMIGDVCPDVELLYSSLSMEELLKQHEDWTVNRLIKYLEAPKPGQTQPDPS